MKIFHRRQPRRERKVEDMRKGLVWFDHQILNRLMPRSEEPPRAPTSGTDSSCSLLAPAECHYRPVGEQKASSNPKPGAATARWVKGTASPRDVPAPHGSCPQRPLGHTAKGARPEPGIAQPLPPRSRLPTRNFAPHVFSSYFFPEGIFHPSHQAIPTLLRQLPCQGASTPMSQNKLL